MESIRFTRKNSFEAKSITKLICEIVVKIYKLTKRLLRSMLCDVLPLEMPALTGDYLIEATFASNDEVTFVQVGAHNGMSNDPIAHLLKKKPKWNGLSIEPVPELYESLRFNRGDTLNYKYANVAIGNEEGTACFYTVDPNGDEAWLSQVGSFSRGHVESHIAGMSRCRIVERQIEVSTLSTVLLRAGISKYDLLIIDAEGYDLEILQQANLTMASTRMVLIEVEHLKESERLIVRRIFHDLCFTVFQCAGGLRRDKEATQVVACRLQIGDRRADVTSSWSRILTSEAFQFWLAILLR